ncbi:MAG: RNB domain-containing ribonuclease, partial [Duodenibacillus sp.]|nr:RNB domain-containing ribonuclease [Duodenibacillus sp.]
MNKKKENTAAGNVAGASRAGASRIRRIIKNCLKTFPRAQACRESIRSFVLSVESGAGAAFDAVWDEAVAGGLIEAGGRGGCRLRTAAVEGKVVGARFGKLFFSCGAGGENPLLEGWEDAGGALSGDTVLAAPAGMQGPRPVYAMQACLARKPRTLMCKIYPAAAARPALAVPCDPFESACIEISRADGKRFGGCFGRVEVDTGSLDALRGRVLEAAGKLSDPRSEIEAAVERFNLPQAFSEAALKEAAAFGKNPGPRDMRFREDMRHLPLVTIDGEDSRDFDDAVWCERNAAGWRLVVAIADVSHYVRPGSALEAEAQARATSVYLPRSVIPMLPEALSNGLCSLNPGVDRCALACDMQVTPEGKVASYRFKRAMMHSHARLTYGAVYKAMQGDPAEIIERGCPAAVVADLHALYKAFAGERARRGAIDFAAAEARAVLDEKGEVVNVVKREHNDAHRLIEECMLAANVCAADFIRRRKLRSLYRVHDAPEPERLLALRATLLKQVEEEKLTYLLNSV